MRFQRPPMIPFSSGKKKEAVVEVKKRDKSSLCPSPQISPMHVGWLCEQDAESYRDVTLQPDNSQSCTFQAVCDDAFLLHGTVRAGDGVNPVGSAGEGRKRSAWGWGALCC